MDTFRDFLNSPIGVSFYLSLGLLAVRVALGIFAAVKDDTFTLSAVGGFIRSQVLGRIMPFATAGFFAFTTGNAALIAAAAAIGATYVAESVGAIQESLSATAKAEARDKAVLGLEIGNEVPTD
jgi:hypothetical protein